MSFDHKPTNPKEKERIEKAGGRVINGRIDNGINVSRGFGDHKFYKNKVSKDLKAHE